MQQEERVSKALAEILEFLRDGLESGVEFASEQVPILIQEILSWGLIYYAMNLLIWISIPGVVLFVAWRLRTWLRVEEDCHSYKDCSGYDGKEVAWVVSHWVLPIASSVWAICVIGTFVPPILKILVAPRLYLIEQVQYLIRYGGVL